MIISPLEMFRRGMDSYDIAKVFDVPESSICYLLQEARTRERKENTDQEFQARQERQARYVAEKEISVAAYRGEEET